MSCHYSKTKSEASLLFCAPHLSSSEILTSDKRVEAYLLAEMIQFYLTRCCLAIYTHHWHIHTSSKQRARLFPRRTPKTLAYHTPPPPLTCAVATYGEGLSVALVSLNSRIAKEMGTPWQREETEVDMPRNGQPQHPREAPALKLHRKPLFLCFHILLVDSTQVTSKGASKQL